MHRCLIICAALLASCGPDPVPVMPSIPPDLLVPARGWEGGRPETEGALVDATAAELRGRLQCNGQLLAIAEIQR